MRLHRFFINESKEVRESLEGKRSITITDKDLLHQWKHVFRFQVGHQLILLDNSGKEFHAQISLLTGTKADLDIMVSKISPTTPAHELFLFVSLIKKDNFEWVLEKGTELGVSHFIPVAAERSEKKNLNNERGLKIIKEATEQSGRAKLPTLHEIFDLQGAINFAIDQKCEATVVLDPEGKHKLDKETFKKIALFIGPEGGWSKKELDLFEKNNIKICSFGAPGASTGAILRAETASIAAASLILL